jgi:light-regulated signal transduction histidine kinase (bacteriophytochrome)
VESRNRELDEFTYVVSHDLKAPLRAISNLSEWLEEDLQDKLDEETSNNITLLRSRVERMNQFIDGLLRYSRAGRIDVDKTIVNVGELLEKIIDSISPPPNFAIAIGENMPTLITESLLLEQVFSNLISNGIKHNEKEKGNIEISVRELDEYYEFAVTDDGVGIAPTDREKIFVIFQTLTARDTKENTGIGLSIVKKIIENQDGKIWLESELGQGSTFYFTWHKS